MKNPFRRHQGILRSRGEIIANGQEGESGGVSFTDHFHIGKEAVSLA